MSPSRARNTYQDFAGKEIYESGRMEPVLEDTLHPGGLELTARIGCLAGLDSASQVLDIACGKGAGSIFLAQKYGCKVVGIDLSPEMVASAREEAKIKTPENQPAFLLAGSGTLPFAAATFDIVMSECSFSLLPDKQHTAGEIRRVLRPGGKFIFTDFILVRDDAADRRDKPAVISYASLFPCVAGAEPLAGYLSVLERAGFRAFYHEDHSIELKKVALRIAIKYGGLPAFLASLPGKSPPVSAPRCLPAGQKLGYALISATNPERQN